MAQSSKLPILILISGIAISCLTYFIISLLENSRVGKSVASICQERKITLEQHIGYIADGLSVQAGLYAIYPNRDIESVDFQGKYSRFLNISNLDQSLFKFQSLSFIKMIDASDRTKFENENKIELKRRVSFYGNSSDFRPLEKNYIPGEFGHFVWMYNARGKDDFRFGWDMMSSEKRIAEVQSAVLNQSPFLSLPETSIDAANQTGNFIIRAYFPVFKNESANYTNRDEIISNCSGVYQSQIFVSSLIDAAFSDRTYEGILLEIFESSAKNARIMHSHFSGDSIEIETLSNQNFDIDKSAVYTEMISYENSHWMLSCSASSSFVKSEILAWYWIVLITALVFSFFVFISMVTHSHSSKVQLVESTVHERSSELIKALGSVENLKLEAQHANHQKSAFIAFLCHEIRNPLHAAMAISRFLKESKMNKENLENILNIDNFSNMMISIVNNVLDLSKIESGKLSLESVDFNLRKSLKDCSSKYSKIANEKDVKFDVKYLGSIPENVTGDPVRISQIISALMSNAVKFTEKGKVEVTVDKLSNKSNVVFESVLIPFHLRVTVIDSGCGIDDSVLSRLFNPYSNEKLSVSREEKGGTGLGLAICKKLVEAMQGSITVETNIGKGSKFSVTLPLFETSSPEIQTDRLLAEEAPQDILKDIKVLYADDQPIIQKFLSRYLDSYTQNIALVNDGLEAVRYVRKSVQIHRNHSPSRSSSKSSSFSQIPEFIPQIIILDLQMPNLNGIEAAKLIHAIDPTLSKILISGSDPPQNLSPNLFKATLLKPLSKEQFISVLTKIHTQNNK